MPPRMTLQFADNTSTHIACLSPVILEILEISDSTNSKKYFAVCLVYLVTKLQFPLPHMGDVSRVTD